MGYTTDFEGSFTLDKPATAEQIAYLNKFSSVRHMKRDVAKLQKLYKGEHGFNGSYGTQGEYFVGGLGFAGQDTDASVIEGNYPPDTQPALWCQWVLNDEGTELMWDGGEKFYSYVEWLEYLIKNFFSVWGITLNGKVDYQGEDSRDLGSITVVDNVVKVETF